MKNIISIIHYFIISLLSLNYANAQELKWSQPQKMTERAFITEVVGQNGEGIFVVRKNYRQPERNAILEHYTKDMKLLHTKNLAANKNEYYAQVVLLPDRLQFFYASANNDTKEIEIHVKNFDFNFAEKGKDSVLAKMPGPD
ncbi:MAG: hypothetical protein EOP53_09940, partial [Sphingobacteriales bacterium]